MKAFGAFTLLVCFIFSCTNDKKNNKPEEKNSPAATIVLPDSSYIINGTVQGMDSGWIFLAHADSTGRGLGKIDSIVVKKGNFEFKGFAAEPGICMLGLLHTYNKKARPFYSFTFFLDKGNTKMTCYKDSLYQSHAWGTKAQDEFNTFREKFYPILSASNNAYGLKLRSKKNQRILDSLDIVFKKYSDEMEDVVVNQAKSNPSSLVSAYIVKDHLLTNPDPDVLGSLYDGFDEKIKNTYFGRTIFNSLLAGKRTAIGLTAPYFNLPDKNGKKISSTSYKGKYVLVDFWASWCNPCRAENPNLVKAYDVFHGKGFEIISVSLDSDKRLWLKAVEADKLPWTQVSDLKGSDSEVKKLYGIVAIPMNYLLDTEGKIIAKDLRGEQLQKKLSSVFE